MKTAYLVAYNCLCFLGWSTCLAYTLWHIVLGSSTSELWQDVQLPLKVSQSAAVLEVAHAAMGLVRSPVATTAQQVASRIFILWGILWAVPGATTTRALHLFTIADFEFELSLFTLLLAWGITEVIRYSFYATKELGGTPWMLVWLRYTTFIVLYPLGVASELALVWLALPTIYKNNMWSYPMPNMFNISFNYYAFCLLFSAAYVPGFPPLYMYMFKQRSKVLGSNKVKNA